MKPRNQRLTLLALAAAAVLGAVVLAMSALREQASFFYAPGDVAQKGLPLDRAVRIGGMVRARSIHRHGDGVTIDFLVGDNTRSTIRVFYRGLTPDLFRENSGVIAEGRFRPDGSFAATQILAKHDENYQPPELTRRGLHETRTLR